MQINFTDEIFDSVPAYKILNAIHTAIEQHHEVMIDTTGPHYIDWVTHCQTSLDPDVVMWISYAFGNSIFVGSERFVQVVKNVTLEYQVTFDELVSSILRSFHIYVENGRADKRFLYSILSPELKRDLMAQEKIGAITFENAGGITELAKKICDDSKSRARLPLRSFALFDSDALSPGEPSYDALEAQRACTGNKIPYYCLSRRAIENYIPEDSLLAYALTGNTDQQRIQRKRIARAVGRLSDVQKSHFHMKEGFKAPHHEPLYDGISPEDRETLNSGFGSHLSSCYEEGGIVNKKILEASSAWSELERLVTSVMEAL